jgi:FkbM family methyltransferase
VSVVRRVRKALARREYPVVPPHIGRIDYNGADIRIGVTSRAVIMSRLRPAAKEPWTVSWIERSMRPGDVFYDVGANVGSYSLIAGAQGLDGVRVVAFEPGYASYAALCDNILLNGQTDVVVPLPVVLGERTGLVMLGYSDVAAGAAEHSLAGTDESVYRQPVLSYRLDDLVDQLALPGPTLLKVDVDGAEAAVLAGAPRTLAGLNLRSVLVEIERDRADDVVRLLEQAGLVVRERVDERDGERLPNVWYGIFERP